MRPCIALVALMAVAPSFVAGQASAACGGVEVARTFATVIDEAGVNADWKLLRETLASSLSAVDVPFKTPAIDDALSQPFSPEMVFTARDVLPALFRRSSATCQRESACPVASREGSAVEALLARMKAIDASLARAFAELPPDVDTAALQDALPALLERTSTGTDLSDHPLGTTLLAAAQAIDRRALHQTAAILRNLVSPAQLEALRAALIQRSPIPTPEALHKHVSGPLLAARQTPIGWLIIGGADDNVYRGPAALIIDLGGNDQYEVPAPARTHAVIDLAGDDYYRADEPGGLAGGILGASLVVDVAGDDHYRAQLVGQGAAVLGIGVLVDHEGHDRYRAGTLAQGAALFGIGMLNDRFGDDDYDAAKYAQGFGGPGGSGVLRDSAGNDFYHAGGVYPSSYGIEGHYQAFSQGVGMGSRGSAAGGVGVLEDLAGDDVYRAGNFTQGVGYYLGVGLLTDATGADRYRGGRYSQGAGAHLGAGMLHEGAGNDSYTGRTAANQGAAWDLAVGKLLDCGGDDDHYAADLSLGAAAQHAVGSLFDAEGVDTYVTGAHALGVSGKRDYGDGRDGASNLGVFLDAGGTMDGYPVDSHGKDGSTILRGQHGLFIDQ